MSVSEMLSKMTVSKMKESKEKENLRPDDLYLYSSSSRWCMIAIIVPVMPLTSLVMVTGCGGSCTSRLTEIIIRRRKMYQGLSAPLPGIVHTIGDGDVAVLRYGICSLLSLPVTVLEEVT